MERENAQLRRAVVSHAVVDQAIGVLVALRRMPPVVGFGVLREVFQRTSVKLHAVAKGVIGWALGRPLPPRVSREVEAAVRRRSRARNAPDARGEGRDMVIAEAQGCGGRVSR